MHGKKETLSPAVANLQQIVADEAAYESSRWVSRLERALSAVEQAVRRQGSLIDSPEGGVSEVSGGQSPSPGMDRRVNCLHDDLDYLLEESQALRLQASLLRSNTTLDRSGTDAIEGLRLRAAALLEALNHYETEEARLILDDATTEIGAGD